MRTRFNLRNILLSAAVCLWSTGANAEELSAVTWKLSAIGRVETQASPDAFLKLEIDGSVSGNGGCNQFMGRFVTNGSAILFSPLASTMMICDDAVSDNEALFLSALQAAREFEVKGTELVLMDASETPVAFFQSE